MEKRHGSVRCFDRWVCGFFFVRGNIIVGCDSRCFNGRTRLTFVVEGWLMHRGGGVAGSGAGGAAGIAGGSAGSGALPSTSHRGLELEHPSAMPGAPGFHWGAMLAGHHAAAAASMMQPPLSAAGEYTPAPAHHGPTHPAMPMDLHVHQGFPYYRLVHRPIRVLYRFHLGVAFLPLNLSLGFLSLKAVVARYHVGYHGS